MKQNVQDFSQRLKNLHKRFLEIEREQAEDYFGRRISSFDFLQLLTSDANFAWLRPFSALIADIDAFLDEANNVTSQDLLWIQAQVESVLRDKNSKVAARYRHHLMHDAEFIVAHAMLDKSLERLLPKASNERAEASPAATL